jgi:hypothetical protein
MNKIPINLTQIFIDKSIKINILPSIIYSSNKYLLDVGNL